MKLPQSRKSGFTLVEMTVVIVFGMALSAAGLLLLNQQVHTARVFNQQDFILTEAPQINNSLVSLLEKADAIQLYPDFNSAIAGTNPVLTDAKTLVAAFRNFDNTTTFGIISLETVAGVPRLDYYFYDRNQAAPTQGDPSWTLSRKIVDADFSLNNGLFQATLTGPQTEQITYTISPLQ